MELTRLCRALITVYKLFSMAFVISWQFCSFTHINDFYRVNFVVSQCFRANDKCYLHNFSVRWISSQIHGKPRFRFLSLYLYKQLITKYVSFISSINKTNIASRFPPSLVHLLFPASQIYTQLILVFTRKYLRTYSYSSKIRKIPYSYFSFCNNWYQSWYLNQFSIFGGIIFTVVSNIYMEIFK